MGGQTETDAETFDISGEIHGRLTDGLFDAMRRTGEGLLQTVREAKRRDHFEDAWSFAFFDNRGRSDRGFRNSRLGRSRNGLEHLAADQKGRGRHLGVGFRKMSSIAFMGTLALGDHHDFLDRGDFFDDGRPMGAAAVNLVTDQRVLFVSGAGRDRMEEKCEEKREKQDGSFHEVQNSEYW